MADFSEDIDLTGLDTDEGWSSASPVPPGDYLVAIHSFQKRPIKAGGDRLCITYSIIDGPYTNRRLSENLNLWHATSDKARDAAKKQLHDLQTICGIPKPLTTTRPFVGKQLVVSVEVRDDKYNDIESKRALPGGAVPQQQYAPAQQAYAQPQTYQQPYAPQQQVYAQPGQYAQPQQFNQGAPVQSGAVDSVPF